MSRATSPPPPAFPQRSPSFAAPRPEPAGQPDVARTIQPATASVAARPHQQAASAPTVPQARGNARRPVLYGFAGFFLGVAFWHAVGFWDFVSEAVFSGPRTQQVQATTGNRFAASPDAFTAGSRFETGSIGNAANAPNRAARPVPATAGKHDRRLDGSSATAPAATAAAQAGACTTVALNANGVAELQPGCPHGSEAVPVALPAAPSSSWSAEIERNHINSIR